MNFTQKSVVAILGKSLSSIFFLFTGILLSRGLGVEGVGQYQLILSTQVLIVTILAMGGGNASIYFINSLKENKVTISTSLLKFYTPMSILFTIIMITSLMWFKDYFGELESSWIVFFAIGSGCLLLYNILTPVLYATLEVLKYQILGLSSAVIMLIGILIFKSLHLLDVNTTLFIVGISNIFAFILFLTCSGNYFNLKLSTDYLLLKRIIIYGIKISAVNLVFILTSNLVVFLLNLLLEDGFVAIGLFSRATSVVNIFLLFPATIGVLFYSKWASMDKENLHRDVEKVLRLFVFLSIGCFIVVFFGGEYIIRILYGEEFLGAKPALNILQASVVFSSISIVFMNLFSSIGKPVILLKIYITSLIITGVLSFILIPIINIQGAAISVLVGIIYNAFALFYFSKKEIQLSILNSIFIQKEDIVSLWNSLKEKR